MGLSIFKIGVLMPRPVLLFLMAPVRVMVASHCSWMLMLLLYTTVTSTFFLPLPISYGWLVGYTYFTDSTVPQNGFERCNFFVRT